MYLLSIHYENTKKNGTGKFAFSRQRQRLRKWTLLPPGPAGCELLQLMALVCGGPGFVTHLPCDLRSLARISTIPFRIEGLMARHLPDDSISPGPHVFGSGIEIDNRGRSRPITKRSRSTLPSGTPLLRLAVGSGNLRFLLLGYGDRWRTRSDRDPFDFSDPFHRNSRFHSLFSPVAPITDPVAFLDRLHYKAIRCARFPAQQTLERVCRLFSAHLGIETRPWLEKLCDFDLQWQTLRSWQRRIAQPILDSVRHIVDATPRSGIPLDRPGIMLVDRPDRFCTAKTFPDWVNLMDCLMPAMQYALTLSRKAALSFPRSPKRRRLAVPTGRLKREPPDNRTRLPSGTILLVDVDGRLPNLALMKLSRHYKEQGRRVVLVRKGGKVRGAERVYASSVFYTPASTKRVDALREYYGDALSVGGSGLDIRRRLPLKIESLPPDYSLYPELEDRAIGFLTRGCPNRCPFCIVPVKEGKTRRVSGLDDLLQGTRRKLILLDDNILSYSNAHGILEDMARRNIQVNFNQTLDMRLLDKEKAQLLRRIRCANSRFTRQVYHFSLNDTGHLNLVREKHRQLGFTPKDNVEFICMYGYNTTLAQDVERFRFLRSLPGAYVFVQRYQPIPGGPPADLARFFDDETDRRIDELVRIIFPQNMKSMETYYRWLSKRYAANYGKLHVGLADTLFRYNNRQRKGRYIATLAGTVRNSAL